MSKNKASIFQLIGFGLIDFSIDTKEKLESLEKIDKEDYGCQVNK